MQQQKIGNIPCVSGLRSVDLAELGSNPAIPIIYYLERKTLRKGAIYTKVYRGPL